MYSLTLKHAKRRHVMFVFLGMGCLTQNDCVYLHLFTEIFIMNILDCLQFQAIMNKAEMNMIEQVSL